MTSLRSGVKLDLMKYPILIKKDLNFDNQIFEYDCGDLWLREDVSFRKDLEHCFDNDIKILFESLDKAPSMSDHIGKIKKYEWRMNYTIPYPEQIKELKPGQEYKIEKDNKHYTYPLKFENQELSILEDTIPFFPSEVLIKFIKKLENVEKLCFYTNIMKGFLNERANQDINAPDEDDYIAETVNNPHWSSGSRHPNDYTNLHVDKLKLIKKSIDPAIKLEFYMREETEEFFEEEGLI